MRATLSAVSGGTPASRRVTSSSKLGVEQSKSLPSDWRCLGRSSRKLSVGRTPRGVCG